MHSPGTSCGRILPNRACATSGVPPRQTASEEACVESALTQRGGDGAADVESVRAVHDNRCIGHELGSPLVNALWIAVDVLRHHVRGPREVIARTCVNHLQWLASGLSESEFFGRDRRNNVILGIGLRLRNSNYGYLALGRSAGTLYEALCGDRPVDVAHERIDIGDCVRTELGLVGVFIHVEHQQRNGVRHHLAIVKRELVVELPVSTRVAQHGPAGTSAKRLGEGNELSSPGAEYPELLLECR